MKRDRVIRGLAAANAAVSGPGVDDLRAKIHPVIGAHGGSILGMLLGMLVDAYGWDATDEIVAAFLAEMKRVATT